MNTPANASADIGPSQFDAHSGGRLERALFNNRLVVVVLALVISLFLGLHAAFITLNASFTKTLPQSHEFVRNYLANEGGLRGMSNVVRIVVENRKGDIYEPAYLDTLRKLNDELYLTPGIDRSYMKSLWMPIVRWTEVTEEGFRGGPVIPGSFTGTAGNLDELKLNVRRAGIIGSLVANDQKSSMIVLPLFEKDPKTGQALDYRALSERIEALRTRYETTDTRIHVIGFAKLVGDLIAGVHQVMGYFLVALVVTLGILLLYTRCIRSTLLVVSCSVLAVVWQLGLIRLLGFELDPYSILVPFLVFAIGVSHGAQKMNGIMQDIGRGVDKYVAARFTFRRLFLAGATALLADAVGFGVLMVIDIPVIRELVMSASIGMAALLVTNLVLVPIFLSYVGVSPRAAAHTLAVEQRQQRGEGARVWRWLDNLTASRPAVIAIAGAMALTLAAVVVRTGLTIGDLDAGAPELRPESRYNRDNDYITSHYSQSSDVFAVMVKTPPGKGDAPQTLAEIDQLEWELQHVPGVQGVVSAAGLARIATAGNFEGNPRWMSLTRSQQLSTEAMKRVATANPEMANVDLDLTPVLAYLNDHKAATLERVAVAAKAFALEHDGEERKFLLAAGSAGLQAATNSVVQDAMHTMLFLVYGAVAVFCLVTFRSWRATVVALVPLAITSLLCEALMVVLGIGVKVATLPVIALGVGIGVDYALYLLSVQLPLQRAGATLREAYAGALRFTGKVIALVGVMLSASVITWAFSPIKFQADMGILLTFMFLWNMVGALVLIPALSRYLLNHVKPDQHDRDTHVQAAARYLAASRQQTSQTVPDRGHRDAPAPSPQLPENCLVERIQ